MINRPTYPPLHWQEKQAWLTSLGLDRRVIRRYRLDHRMDESCWLVMVREAIRSMVGLRASHREQSVQWARKALERVEREKYRYIDE